MHVLHNGKALFNEVLQLDGRGRQVAYQGKLDVAAGDSVDCVVGWGNGSHVCDSTGLEFRLTDAQGKSYDAAKEFRADAATAGPLELRLPQAGPHS